MEISSGENYENLKELYREQGEYGKAVEYSRKILESKKKKLGKTHATVADEYQSLANLYYNLGEYGGYVRCSLKAIHIKEIVPENKGRDLADWYYGLSLMFKKFQGYANALKYAQKASYAYVLFLRYGCDNERDFEEVVREIRRVKHDSKTCQSKLECSQTNFEKV